MDRARHIDTLKGLLASEERAARTDRPYLDRQTARAAEQRHWSYVSALRWAIAELEDIRPLTREIPDPCPEPVSEGDEYRCTHCLRRWDRTEERPPCAGNYRDKGQ